ncbi:permease prefix domain 1-containing protein [Paenibacillus sp. sptzw28]|uniref:permease prefix domain 1-containing protein n=1 Tax=Paenibacillus sp. sptzw28 TaxID=715179 RepID=UPI001C6ECC39|nr:permease prefix domain 1-containing protein [Paenibacillus sp. sptzw28]QYR22420.1 permease prefix domain 1-containing protein [Paenibacillus sp. sptzw28]
MAKKTEFTDYVRSFTETLTLNPEEKDELREELEQHLGKLMTQFIVQGQSKQEAMKRSLEQFGDPEQLRPEFQKSHIPSWKQYMSKEILIWLICLAAASVGPSLLINAHYSPLFVAAPLMYLIVCAMLYHGIIQRIRRPILWITMFLLLYSTFTWDMIQYHSFKLFIEEFVTFRLGGEGLATISITHLLWVGVLLRFLNKGWRALARISYEYWAMFIIAFYMMRAELITSSGEGHVLLLNTFLLYVFFQQMIESQIVVKIKNKIKHWLVQG